MIAILDCPVGESAGIKEAFGAIGAEAELTDSIDGLQRAAKIVLPPGASFPRTIRCLRDRGLVGSLIRAADQGRHLLGIGQGLHLLFDVSHEAGQHTGLGLIPGKVTPFDLAGHPVAAQTVLPHQGWGQVRWTSNCPLFTGLVSGEYFYFEHSCYAEPLDERLVAAECTHGIDFSAAVWRGNVFATQFLPEKSNEAGLRVLANFASL